MSAADFALMTSEEFLALPDDGKERMLIRGQLWETEDADVTVRNRYHSFAVIRLGSLLTFWLEQQPAPHGAILGGEAGCILRRDPDTIVGIDVAYFSAETMAAQSDATTMIEGAPVLAVEVLSPSDKQDVIYTKVRQYLDAGTQLVWIVDPQFRTVQVHRTGHMPKMCNADQSLSGGDVLPGLQIALAEIFPNGELRVNK